jgi:hypothetical protein
MTTAAPITTESILQEDGAAAALGKFATEVRAGEEQTRKFIASAASEKVWTFRDLRDGVFDAARGQLRKTAVTVALMSLDKIGVIQIDYARSTVVIPS